MFQSRNVSSETKSRIRHTAKKVTFLKLRLYIYLQAFWELSIFSQVSPIITKQTRPLIETNHKSV